MKRKIMGLFLTISFILSLGMAATAAEFPTKYITLIIPMTAGGSMDVTGRALGNAAKKFLGQPIIPEHIPGGGGTVGLAIMVKKPADGYTIAYIATNNLNINWHMREMSFHPIVDRQAYIGRGRALQYNLRFRGGTGEKREQKEDPGGGAQSGRRKAKRLSLQ